MELIAPYIIVLLLASLVYLWAREVFYLHQIRQKLKSILKQDSYICMGYPSKSKSVYAISDTLFKCGHIQDALEQMRQYEDTTGYGYVVLFLCDPEKGFVKIGEIKNENYSPTKQTD